MATDIAVWGESISGVHSAMDSHRCAADGLRKVAARLIGAHHPPMLNSMSQWVVGAPARQIRAGLWMFFAGSGALFFAMLAQLVTATPDGIEPLVDSLPGWPTFFVPESPAGFTVAAWLVCRGVWSMGAGLKAARNAAAR